MTEPEEFHVRRAEAADAAVLDLLEHAARAALVDVRGGRQALAEQPSIADWEALILQDDHRVWVAEIDDVVVGYLQLQLTGHHLADRVAVGRVIQVYVEPEARQVGFGDELLACAMAEIRLVGGSTVEAWALPGDRDTKNLFERAAVTARKIIVSRRLD